MTPVTVEEVREAQEMFKVGVDLQEKKDFTGASENFRKTVLIHSQDENHLKELEKKLKEGKFKLQQESIAYMGCAAVHLSTLVKDLTEEQRNEVPVDEKLSEIFGVWDEG
ncbi:MAG: hypothetical protein IID18_08785 [Nitrospinae bacterium]|nr:hypothetical protein [Nitrospinota bacterium]